MAQVQAPLRDVKAKTLTRIESNITGESFIEGLRDMQEGLALLRTIRFDNEKMIFSCAA